MTSSGGWFNCKDCNACSLSDPTVDTVTIKAPVVSDGNKENEVPEQRSRSEEQLAEKEREGREEKERRERQTREEAEAEAAVAVAAAAEAEEEEEEEKRRAAAAESEAAESEAAARRQRALEEEELCRREEEELQRVLQASLDDERQREEAARKEREAKEAEEQARAAEESNALHAKVATWLKANGFSDVKAKKKTLMSGSKYPLHKAVENKDAEMASALIKCGADKTAQNSKKQTALQLADKNNKAGTLDSVIAALVN